MHFPPLLGRRTYERTDHIETMPQLLGSVHSFFGADEEHAEMVRRLHAGEDWAGPLGATDTVLVPAACYPLYPTVAGSLPAERAS